MRLHRRGKELPPIPIPGQSGAPADGDVSQPFDLKTRTLQHALKATNRHPVQPPLNILESLGAVRSVERPDLHDGAFCEENMDPRWSERDKQRASGPQELPHLL